MGTTNHADEIYSQRQAWAKLANACANDENVDAEFLTKVIRTAAMWEEKWEDYISHLKVTKTSFHSVV